MTCAMSVILIMQIQIEKRAVIFGTIGSIPGFIVGSLFIDVYLTSQQKKMLFVSIWSSFAIALFILNVQHGRKTYDIIPNFKPWKASVLIMTGLVGGIFTAFAGSGVDICVFSILTLLFRVTEKTATPTSVVLMGINTMIGVYWRAVWEGNISNLALEYAIVSVPIAVTMAPLGSFLGSHLHRQILAIFIYVLEGLAVIGFIITKPAINLMINGAIIVFVAFIFFICISKAGKKLIQNEEALRYQTPESLNDLII
uniref:Membrane transporter protein n=1 Tax=Heterorhabditis bacteriophora TaxID=37862 RepID=A0A1I7XS80_HETBA